MRGTLKPIWVPTGRKGNVKSLAAVRLKPREGFVVILQILELVVAAHHYGMVLPVRLEDHQIDEQGLQVALKAQSTILAERYAFDSERHKRGSARQREQISTMAAEGLRLIRNPKLFGAEYEFADPEEMVMVEFLIMMHQGAFPTADLAYERALQIMKL